MQYYSGCEELYFAFKELEEILGGKIDMTIAITGATGFIGNCLVSNLKNKSDEYVCLVRKESDTTELEKNTGIKIIRTDFSPEEITKILSEVDVLVYLIGQMGEYGVSDDVFYEVNYKLTKQFLEVCLAVKLKQFIYVSTPGVQGFGNRYAIEDLPYAPRNIYEKTKMDAEQLIIRMLKDTSVFYTIIRPDFVYGPGDYRRIKLYKNIRDHKFVLTTSGKSHVHPTYVLDVAQGILCAIDNKNAYNEVFNISADEDIEVREYLAIIGDYFHVKILKINIGYYLSIFFAGLIEFICERIFKKSAFVTKNKIDFLAIDHSTSCKKAKDKIGYAPAYSFQNGFKETMKWCEEKNLI